MWLRRSLKVVHYDDVEHRVTLTWELPAPMRDSAGQAVVGPYAGPEIRLVLDYGRNMAPPANDALHVVGRPVLLDIRTI
jgi:hypothetical protein